MVANGNGSRGQDLTRLPRALTPRNMDEHLDTDYTAVDSPANYAPEAERVRINLERLANEIQAMPLDRIAELVRALTYGEMIEAAEAIATLFRGKEIEVSVEAVAGILHDWAKQRQRAR